MHSTTDPITDLVKSLLADLGTTSDEIAANLKRLRCTGHRKDCTRCPIAVYLEKHGIYLRDTRGVAGGEVEFISNSDYRVVPLSKPIREFIDQFDEGEHPDLLISRL